MSQKRFSRRSFLQQTGLALGVSGLARLDGAVAQTPKSRPNILFAFGDDWGRYASAYRKPSGDETPCAIVSTPHFDRVAREGVLFNNAFIPAPSCTPCRGSLLTGQYFYRLGLGAILSGARWDASIPSYPLLLESSGYHVGFSYKAWSPGSPKDAPHGGASHRYNEAGSNYNQFSQYVIEGPDMEARKKELYDEARKNFESFLEKRRKGQPFCYWFGATNVHRKWIQGSGKKIWGLNPDDLKGRMPQFLPDVHEVREDMCDYLGEVQAFDAGIGVILKKLEEIGELDNTLVVLSGDHGIPGFPRSKTNLYDIATRVALAVSWGAKVPGGRTVDDFVNLKDLAPTFLEAGGLKPLAVMTSKSFMDVLLSKAQGQVDPSRTYVITGRERHVRDAREGNLPYPLRALRTADYLYIRNFKPDRWPAGTPTNLDGKGPEPTWEELVTDTMVTMGDVDAGPTKAWLVTHRNDPKVRPLFDLAFGKRPGEELYDLKKDPDQMTNVADRPEYAEVKKALRTQLMDELKSTGDPRVLGDGSTFDKPPYAGD